jgi:5-amino-6-(5-phosphoribosylamino)uracil reductase
VTLPVYHSLDLPEPPPGRPYVILNMVMSVDGKAAIGRDERGMGSAADQHLMRQIRANADLILSGAGTLRATGVSPRLGCAHLEQLRRSRGKPNLPTSVVLTRSGNLPFERPFFTADDFDAVVYVAHSAPNGTVDAIVSAGRPAVRLPHENAVQWMLAHMRYELGAKVLLAEGGSDVNAQLFALDVIDEFFITLAPLVVGGRETVTPVGGAAALPTAGLPRFSIVSHVLNDETNELYLRYRRVR